MRTFGRGQDLHNNYDILVYVRDLCFCQFKTIYVDGVDEAAIDCTSTSSADGSKVKTPVAAAATAKASEETQGVSTGSIEKRIVTHQLPCLRLIVHNFIAAMYDAGARPYFTFSAKQS